MTPCNPASKTASIPPLVCLSVLVSVLFTFSPRDSHAHLSIIRQGLESAGAPEAGDGTGAALAAGDFDNDGYEDLAIGAPDEDASAGAVM